MKRRPPASPLFKDIEPSVYLVDTSAWSDIDNRSDAEDVWKLIGDLIRQRRVVACPEILNEMRDQEYYLLRISPYEDELRAGGRNDTEFLMHVGRITLEHQAMAGARSIKDKADPYVVALAELESYVVVANETCHKRPNRKIPGVCKLRGILCRSLDEFLSEVR
jgi:Domain of unknown function (DUF4411)